MKKTPRKGRQGLFQGRAQGTGYGAQGTGQGIIWLHAPKKGRHMGDACWVYTSSTFRIFGRPSQAWMQSSGVSIVGPAHALVWAGWKPWYKHVSRLKGPLGMQQVAQEAPQGCNPPMRCRVVQAVQDGTGSAGW